MVTNYVKRELWLPLLVSSLASVLVGIGSAAVTVAVVTVRLEERMTTLERDVIRHGNETTKAVERHESKLTDMDRRDTEQEQRLVRGESVIEAMRGDVKEIKTDVKTLIHENK